MTAALVEAAPASPEPHIVEREAPSADWLQAWWDVDGRGRGDFDAACEILDRIKLRRSFAEYHDAEGVGSVLLGVLDGPWLGFYCLATAPRARRMGYASSLMRRVMQSASERGARSAHLAVLDTNPAKRLYANLGFAERQRYSYYASSA